MRGWRWRRGWRGFGFCRDCADAGGRSPGVHGSGAPAHDAILLTPPRCGDHSDHVPHPFAPRMPRHPFHLVRADRRGPGGRHEGRKVSRAERTENMRLPPSLTTFASVEHGTSWGAVPAPHHDLRIPIRRRLILTINSLCGNSLFEPNTPLQLPTAATGAISATTLKHRLICQCPASCPTAAPEPHIEESRQRWNFQLRPLQFQDHHES